MSLEVDVNQSADSQPSRPDKGHKKSAKGKKAKDGAKGANKKGKEAGRADEKQTPKRTKYGKRPKAHTKSKLAKENADAPERLTKEKSAKSDKDRTGKSTPSTSKSNRGKGSSKNQFRPRKNFAYSAIDLGTNNCRLLIAKKTRSGFRVIDAFSRIVRLGEGVGADNRLSEEAMDRTIEALKVCAEKLARRNVTFMRHVATEACRIADNSEEFVARVKKETGINLDVISAGEEARLAVLGCQSLIAPDKKNVLVFDIGGGSTELIWVRVRPGRANEIRGWMSVPWGVVNLTEKFAKPGKTPKPKKYAKMIETMRDHLVAFEDAHELSKVLKGRHTQFLGTSGTVTTLASLHLGLPKYNREKVDGAWMKSKDIRKLSRQVAEMTPEQRAAEPCIGSERADLVVAGCAILEAILSMWPVPSLRVADRGIREGILRGLMELDEPPRHVPLHKVQGKPNLPSAPKSKKQKKRDMH